MPKKTTKPKAVKAWAIVSPRGKIVGFGRTKFNAWCDVPWSNGLFDYPFTKNPKPGYRAVQFVVPPLK